MKSVLNILMNCANKFDRIGDGLIQIEVSILRLRFSKGQRKLCKLFVLAFMRSQTS